MKKNLVLGLAAVGMIAFTSCEKKEAVAATDAETVATATEEAAVYTVDTAVSSVNWHGYKFYEAENKEEGHYGTLKLAKGEIKVENHQIVAGSFVIDTNTLESEDLNEDPEKKAKLDGHLKSPDFLDVEKYPEATFNITAVKTVEGDYNTEISGNFKFRDVEKNITFKANVAEENNSLAIKSEEFTINRQDFGITFEGGHGSVIKDNVSLKVNLTSNKVAEVSETVEVEVSEEAAH